MPPWSDALAVYLQRASSMSFTFTFVLMDLLVLLPVFLRDHPLYREALAPITGRSPIHDVRMGDSLFAGV